MTTMITHIDTAFGGVRDGYVTYRSLGTGSFACSCGTIFVGSIDEVNQLLEVHSAHDA